MSAGPDEQANPSDIEIVRAVYAAMAERDLDRLVEMLDPACVITQDPACLGAAVTSVTKGSRTSACR
jgi:limonene-1,2-epoxide hydrolase